MKSKIKFLQNFKHDHKAGAYILAWIGFVLGIAILICVALYKTIPYFLNVHLFSKPIFNILFDYLDQFTIQSNILLVIFYALWLFAYKSKIFKNNLFLIACASYIFLVFLIAWFVMAPIFVIQNTVNANVFEIVDHLCVHFITPLIFLIFFIFATSYRKVYLCNEPLSYVKNWSLIMIYPLLYFCALIIINFIKLPQNVFNYNTEGHSYISVYNILTNYNHNCWVPVWDTNIKEWVVDPQNLDWQKLHPLQQGQLWRIILVPLILVVYSIIICVFIYLANWRSGFYKTYKRMYSRKLIY